MTSAVEKAMIRYRGISNTAHDTALRMKASGVGLSLAPSGGMGAISQFQQQGANRSRYARFRGWVHSAINAIATEAGTAPASVGYPKKKKADTRRKPGDKKSIEDQYEISEDHPLIDCIERPNPMQHRHEFVYSFIANLCLTGWSFIIGGKTKGKGGKDVFEF